MSPPLPGLDLAALTEYLQREVPGVLAAPLTGRLLSGGRSNLTYLVSDGHTEWVVRRPPLGHVLETAHDMGREHRVMSALRGSPVPVPSMLALCQDPEVLGAPFYVMEYVDGTIYRTAEDLSSLRGNGPEVLADGLVDVLADLHAVDAGDRGLGDLGRPDGFLERQVRRWGKQLAASDCRQLVELEDLGRRLAASVPTTGRAGLVHGDYKLDNVVVGAAAGTVLAVLDWEMATLGDPLTDLVNLVVWWDGVRDEDGTPITAVPADVPGFPPSSRLVDRYAEVTGADLGDLAWYSGLVCYKLAAIFEGMHYRNQQGLTLGEGFDALGGLAPALARRGHEVLDGVTPAPPAT